MTVNHNGVPPSPKTPVAIPSSPANVGRYPLNEQLSIFRTALERNTTLLKVLQGACQLDLPNWYLAAGAVTQTVWNSVTDQPPETGIDDYDVVYFDDSDLSWEAEDVAIKRGDKLFEEMGLNCKVEIRNQARVHLWYTEKFGVPCPEYQSTEEAIDAWTSNTAMIGVNLTKEGDWRVYAPVGLSDMFNLVVRPNALIATRQAYEKKIARWQKYWSGLTIHPWPEGKIILPEKK